MICSEQKVFSYFRYFSRKFERCKSVMIFQNSCFFSTCEMRKQSSKNLRKQSASYKISLQTLGTGACGASRSLYVITRNDKILFNCGEGTRRIATEYNVDIGQVSNVFVTSNSWKNVSGLSEIQELDQKKMKSSFKTYGPHGLKTLMGGFSHLDSNSSLNPHNNVELQTEQVDFEGSISIQALPLYSADKSVKIRKSFQNKLNTRSKYILAYICTIPPSGTLSSEKLVLAGVPYGPLVDRLKKGSSVTLPNGKIVSPYEVSNGPVKGTTFIVVEISDFKYLDALTSCTAFDRHQGGPTCLEEDIPEVIVHFSPPEVMLDSRYRHWVNSFPPSVSHLVINEKNTCLGLKDMIEMQIRLNQIFPTVFPLHVNPGVPFAASQNENTNEEDLDQEDLLHQEDRNPFTLTSEYQFNGPTVQSNSLFRYCIWPRIQFNSSSCPVIYPKHIIQSCFAEESVLSSLNLMEKKFEEVGLNNLQKQQKSFPVILFLGTGSAVPTPTRNVPGILITASSQDCIMLDCGEGTFGQLIRFMGEEGARSTLCKLKLVFVSHHHYDHHAGLPSLLIERQKSFKIKNKKLVPLYMCATPLVIKYLEHIHHYSFPILENVILLKNSAFLSPSVRNSWQYNDLCQSLNFEEILISFVSHCHYSFGVALSHIDGWKIVYSGDCQPSKGLVDIGLNCDLLIHEATLEDGMEAGAKKTGHSTVSQALQVGREMNAKFIILNHFSQRYDKISIIGEDCLPNNVGIAFDFMKVTLEDLPYLPYIYPSLKELLYRKF